MNLKLHLIFIIIAHFCTNGFTQILDDSTKQIYNANSTKYVLENDLLNNKYNIVKTDTSLSTMGASHKVDTIIDGFHNYNFTVRDKNFRQDLGNYLSPIQDIYYHQPQEIGKQLGYSTLDLYAINPKNIKYFDTKSPYSKVEYIQGTKGQQGITVELSRNITPNWNMGFDFRRQTSKKILGTSNGAGGSLKALENSDYFFAFYTRAFSTNQRYQLLANFTHGHQINYNTGGIKPTKRDSIVSENFNYELAETFFTAARGIDKRYNFHLYQEYALTKNRNIQLYAISDYGKKTVRFNNNLTDKDNRFIKDTALYASQPLFNTIANTKWNVKKMFNFTSLLMADRTEYSLLENQIGIKGKLGKVDFRGYYRRKDFSYKQLGYIQDSLPFSKDSATFTPADSIPVNRIFVENFIGTQWNWQLDENTYALFDAAYMLGRDYRFRVELGHRNFKLGYSKMYYSPTLVQLENRSNLKALSWNNLNSNGNSQFLNTQSDAFLGELKFVSKRFTFNPGLRYELIRNLVYYDTLARPNQAKSNLNFITADVFLAFQVWRIHLETYTKYTYQNIDSFWVVPKIFNRNRIYFENDLFKKAAVIQLGVDVYWRSSYYGYSYMPVTQQFYANNTFLLKSFVQTDVFLNIQIKNASVFLKYAFVNQGRGGYFITPSYTAIPSSFDFGIRWMFYD